MILNELNRSTGYYSFYEKRISDLETLQVMFEENGAKPSDEIIDSVACRVCVVPVVVFRTTERAAGCNSCPAMVHKDSDLVWNGVVLLIPSKADIGSPVSPDVIEKELASCDFLTEQQIAETAGKVFSSFENIDPVSPAAFIICDGTEIDVSMKSAVLGASETEFGKAIWVD